MTSNGTGSVEHPAYQPGKGNLGTQMMNKPKNTPRKIYFQYMVTFVRDDLRLNYLP
jgi:hypothetical protein